MKLTKRSILSGLIVAVGALCFFIALCPEPASRLLVNDVEWTTLGTPGKLRLSDFPPVNRHLRESVVKGNGKVYRSWSAEHGTVAFSAVSPPFLVPRHLGAAVTGQSNPANGGVTAYLACNSHDRRITLFSGDANTNAVEAITSVPEHWCPGLGRVTLNSRSPDINVGIGPIYQISAISALKTSFLGLLPYVFISLVTLGIIAIVGGALIQRWSLMPAFISALAALAIMSLLAFLTYAALPVALTAAWSILIVAFSICITWGLGIKRLTEFAKELIPYASIWTIASVGYFALLLAGHNGLGHWEPNYRFWPATWSSDNELPWIFALGVRNDLDLANLFGGLWKPTDRPPLMAGMHLLVWEPLELLQAFNDGTHLRGLAHNVGAITFNALWLPTAYFVLTCCFNANKLTAYRCTALLALTPFVIFNTVFGWPKALGAAFGLSAAAIALTICFRPSPNQRVTWFVLFGILASASILSHASGALFLLPVSVLLLARQWKNLKSLTVGAIAGFIPLASWRIYTSSVLPTHDPVTRYALTGDLGFSTPNLSILEQMQRTYSQLNWSELLNVKITMLFQPFAAISTHIAATPPMNGFGASGMDLLRGHDSLYLSGGNLVIVACALVGAAHWIYQSYRSPHSLSAPPAAAAMLGVCIASIAFVWAVFMAPLVLHVLPYAAVMGIALTAFYLTASIARISFAYIYLASATYALVVWVLSPISTMLSVDETALVACLAVFAFVSHRMFAPGAELVAKTRSPTQPF